MEELLNWLQNVDPLWSVALVAVAVVVLLVTRLWGTSAGRLIAIATPLVLLAGLAGAGYYAYVYFEGKRTLEERRALDERAASILSQAVQPGSVFACLDGSPAPAMMEACERNLFAEPQRVAAAVAIVTQRIGFLADALEFADARDASYLQRIESLRNSIEADPYGFVAYVFTIDHRCTVDTCERFRLLRDPARVKENIRVRRFEAFMAKHAPSWRASSAVASELEPVKESPMPPGGERPSVSGVSIGERAGAVAIGDPTSAGFGSAPTPPAEPAAPAAVSVDGPPVEPAAAEAPPTPAARPLQAGKEKSKSPVAAKNPPEAKDGQAAAAAKGAAAKSAGKAKADPASKRSSEPVAGLPRIVPRDFVKEKEEEPAAQASGQGQAQPGAPISITPQQN